ncbi:MAG: hypothetical protein PHF99_04930 [Bacteroidales bacterium]|nr:hypothetical protein [Bacteroidales bacterium]MDD4235339.1 hypothetical protein [Bacteroidales bacterium]
MKKTGLLVLSLSFLFLLFACNNTEKKNDTEKLDNEEKKSEINKTGETNEDFEEFYKKFVSDENFQIERVKFPVIGSNIIDYEESEEWTTENWRMLSDVSNVDQNEFTVEILEDDNRIEHKIYLPNSGFGITYTFELIEGKWYLTERTDMSL